MAGVKIRIAERRAVKVGGALRREGEIVTVPAEQAKALVADGYAERGSKRKRAVSKKGATAAKRSALDAAEDDPLILERG